MQMLEDEDFNSKNFNQYSSIKNSNRNVDYY